MRFHETMHVIVEIEAFNEYSDIILKMLLGKNFPDREKQGILNQQREKSGQKFRKKVASLMSAVKCRCGSSSKTHPVTMANRHNGQSVARCHIAEFPLQEQSQWQNSVGRV